MVATPRTHPRLGFPSHGSIAVGSVTNGFLVDGALLPLAGPHHRVLATQATRHTNFGTDELVGLIREAARVVAEAHPGAVLGVGNVAKAGGGHIPWSVSHNTGLDGDLAFYLRDDAGAQVFPSDLVHIDADGRCVERDDCRLDVPRTWTLVAALLSSERAAVQWLFVSRPIKAALLAHARAQGASRALLARAAQVLHQPRGTLPHDDHVHIRLFCPANDLLEGCRNTGVERPWMPRAVERIAARVATLRRLLRHAPEASRRADAVELLRRLRARVAAPEIIHALADSDPIVRAAARRAARTLRFTAAVPKLAARLRASGDALERWDVVDTLQKIGGQRAGAALVKHLSDRRSASRGEPFPASTVARRAARALAEARRFQAVGFLIDALTAGESGPDDATRAALLRSLHRLTNRTAGSVGAKESAAKWRRWWRRARREKPSRWHIEGFRRAGYRLRRLDRHALPTLLAAVLDERPWLSENARRSLAELAGRGVASVRWSRADASRYWRRWCVRRYGERRCVIPTRSSRPRR